MLGEGAHARVQTCINLITNQEYAVKVSTASSPVPFSPAVPEIWHSNSRTQWGKPVSKNDPRASDSGHPLEFRSTWAEPPKSRQRWEVTMKCSLLYKWLRTWCQSGR